MTVDPGEQPGTPTELPGPAGVNDEIAAMRRLVNALEALDPTTQRRVLRWLVDRYQQIEATT